MLAKRLEGDCMGVERVLEELEAACGRRYLNSLNPSGRFVIKDGRPLLNLASNDYLGISLNDSLKEEFLASHALSLPLSSASSRSLSGNFRIYEEFEAYLSSLFSGKRALLFNSGYHLNISCIQALSSLDSVLFLADRFVHASVIDGLRLGKAKFKRYAHNDLDDLGRILESTHQKFDSVIVITEGLFSMEGSLAKLEGLCALKKKYKNLLIYLDEAHSVGVFGDDGLGLARKLGLDCEVDFLVFTFGKAIGSIGASMLCAPAYREFFINKARGLIYSTALPPFNVAWSFFVFKKLASFVADRDRLTSLASLLKKECLRLDRPLVGEAQILSFLTFSNEAALSLASRIEDEGFFSPAIRSPTVPKDAARIRISLTALLDEDSLMRLAAALFRFYKP